MRNVVMFIAMILLISPLVLLILSTHKAEDTSGGNASSPIEAWCGMAVRAAQDKPDWSFEDGFNFCKLLAAGSPYYDAKNGRYNVSWFNGCLAAHRANYLGEI